MGSETLGEVLALGLMFTMAGGFALYLPSLTGDVSDAWGARAGAAHVEITAGRDDRCAMERVLVHEPHRDANGRWDGSWDYVEAERPRWPELCPPSPQPEQREAGACVGAACAPPCASPTACPPPPKDAEPAPPSPKSEEPPPEPVSEAEAPPSVAQEVQEA